MPSMGRAARAVFLLWPSLSYWMFLGKRKFYFLVTPETIEASSDIQSQFKSWISQSGNDSYSPC